ncbi:MAG: ATP-binding protein, partial [Acidimicrobiia bacterium]
MKPVPSGGVVCVLFTDLVGSTELMSRLGDVAFDALRGEHFARMREAAASGGGVEVKNTGDGILATFSSAVEALSAAVVMQQATLNQGKRAGVDLSLRVGLSLGEATFEDGDVFGTPVVEAARLVAAARPGQILATAMVKMVAGSRCPVPTRDLGALELKGLPDPVAVYEAVWEPAAATTVPLPLLMTGTGRVFVGRSGEVERLSQLWKEAAEGERRVALLGGEPGVGKTRLAAEVAGAAHEAGAVVLAGRCDEDLGVPYQPFVEALRHYVRGIRPADLRLGRHGGDLARLLPELAEVVPGLPEPLRSDPETERYRLFEAVTAWLVDVSAETPVLLVLDDLQWATKPTLMLARHVTRSSEPLRLLIVGTYRDTELSRTHPLAELLADLRRQAGVERIALAGLDQAGVGAYLEAAAGHDLSDTDRQLVQAVWSETEGNPFFVGEVLRHLIESGALAKEDGRWVTTTEDYGIPEGVREVVGRRLNRLSPEANQVLTLAAVVGPVFDTAVLLAVAGLDEDTVCAALEEAVAARLVVDLVGPVPRSRFAHALVRATLYDEVPAVRRVGLHRRVAEAIETVHGGRLDDHLPALAHHWARAAAPAAETERAVDYAVRAGDRAQAQLAHDEAVSYYRQALDLLDQGGGADDARRLELLISLGVAQRRAADPAHRGTLLDAGRLAQERGDAQALARAALANSRGFLSSVVGTVDAERVTALEMALAELSSEDSTLRARLLAHLGVEQVYAGDRNTRVALSDQALAMARRLGDASTLADVLLSRFYTILAPSTLGERRSNTAELLLLAEELGDQAMACQANWQRMRTALESGDFSEGHRCLQAQERLAAELGEPSLRLLAALSRTGPALAAGRISEAEQFAFDVFALAEAVDAPSASLFLVSQLTHIRFEQGRFG